MSHDAVILFAHGSVDALSDLPEFLTNIRHGRRASPEMLNEVKRRHEAIGGSSPLNAIHRELACKVQAFFQVPVQLANRFFHPYPKDVLAELYASGVRRVATVPLAQHSAGAYGAALRQAAQAVGNGGLATLTAPNWGQEPKLTELYARQIVEALERVASGNAARTAILMTAHSVPVPMLQAGDPYETEFRASAEAVANRLFSLAPGAFAKHVVAFQSQSLDRSVPWLGPDLQSALKDLAADGYEHVVVAPIGFLADHVEILYDVDIEARGWARELGITLYRSESLNDKSELAAILATVAKTLLERTT
ncbi:MAG: ferrochelatase [Polyangiaceae bacterium]|nr:ferrochelatase [Polyangiaceae bacterium]